MGSPVLGLAAVLIALLATGLTVTAKRRSSGVNWTAVTLAVGLSLFSWRRASSC
jgi:hypothetical protein